MQRVGERFLRQLWAAAGRGRRALLFENRPQQTLKAAVHCQQLARLAVYRVHIVGVARHLQPRGEARQLVRADGAGHALERVCLDGVIRDVARGAGVFDLIGPSGNGLGEDPQRGSR